MFKFHQDKKRYFDIQYKNSKEFIIPFVKKYLEFETALKVMEIGCAEAGVLKAFIEEGHLCTGVELSLERIKTAKQFLKAEVKNNRVTFINHDIFDLLENPEYTHQFDLIILKDVIEHLPNQEEFISKLKSFLSPAGFIFFGFPPWQMPFGGHQQMCSNKLAAVLPYYHILPASIYKFLLKIFGESEGTINSLLEIKTTGISIERFKKIVKRTAYKIIAENHFLINPIYKYKFNLKPKRQFKLISAIVYLRNFMTTTSYYLIKPIRI